MQVLHEAACDGEQGGIPAMPCEAPQSKLGQGPHIEHCRGVVGHLTAVPGRLKGMVCRHPRALWGLATAAGFTATLLLSSGGARRH